MAGKITAIQTQQRRAARANVYIDGQFAFSLQLIEAARLNKGQYLGDEDISALLQVDEEERAHEIALRLLSFRPRSTNEVVGRLKRHGFREAAIDATVDRLAQSGLLDDAAFAQYWISNREQFRPRGQRALRYELRHKGVATEIIDSLLDEVDEPENAYRVATEWLTKWEHTTDIRNTAPAVIRRKLIDHLARRGFDTAVAQEAWERLRAERVEDDLEREDTTTWD